MSGSRFAVGKVQEIPPGSRRIVKLGGRSIGVFNVHGEFFAIRNRCPHQGGPLCLGSTTGVTTARFVDGERPEIGWEREGELIRCPWHAWEFDLRTGQAVFGQGWRVAIYRTVIDETTGDATPVLEPSGDVPASVKVPPPLESYKTTVESGVVIVDLSAAPDPRPLHKEIA
jgi:3-phenylpropionate/trans-cinnamate dioxygenase ferredoxin subunit